MDWMDAPSFYFLSAFFEYFGFYYCLEKLKSLIFMNVKFFSFDFTDESLYLEVLDRFCYCLFGRLYFLEYIPLEFNSFYRARLSPSRLVLADIFWLDDESIAEISFSYAGILLFGVAKHMPKMFLMGSRKVKDEYFLN